MGCWTALKYEEWPGPAAAAIPPPGRDMETAMTKKAANMAEWRETPMATAPFSTESWGIVV